MNSDAQFFQSQGDILNWLWSGNRKWQATKSVVANGIFTVAHLNSPWQNMCMYMLTATISLDQKPWDETHVRCCTRAPTGHLLYYMSIFNFHEAVLIFPLLAYMSAPIGRLKFLVHIDDSKFYFCLCFYGWENVHHAFRRVGRAGSRGQCREERDKIP